MQDRQYQERSVTATISLPSYASVHPITEGTGEKVVSFVCSLLALVLVRFAVLRPDWRLREYFLHKVDQRLVGRLGRLKLPQQLAMANKTAHHSYLVVLCAAVPHMTL